MIERVRCVIEGEVKDRAVQGRQVVGALTLSGRI